jgi:hypothetical protein
MDRNHTERGNSYNCTALRVVVRRRRRRHTIVVVHSHGSRGNRGNRGSRVVILRKYQYLFNVYY